MEIMKKLKGQTIARLILPVLLCVFIGIIGIGGSNLFAEEPTPMVLSSVPRDQLEGAYVTVELDWIYGCYAYTEETVNGQGTGKITEQEYVIDANAEDYMALILSGDMMDQADALLEECDDYYYGLTDQITKGFRVTGYVKQLPSDSLSLYREAMGYYSLSEAEKEIILPLYLSPADYSIQIVPLIFGIAFFAAAIIMLVLAFTGWYQRQVKEKVDQLFGGNTERANEVLGSIQKNVPAVAGMQIGNGLILLRHGSSHYLYDSNDLVWAYKQITRQKLYGIIPIGKTFSLMLKLSNGKEIAVPMNEAKVKEQLEKLIQQFPTCAIGYSDQLAGMYRNDPTSLRQVAAAQRGQVPQQ